MFRVSTLAASIVIGCSANPVIPDGGGQDGAVDDSGGDGGPCFTSTNTAPGYTAVALACGQNTPSGIAVHNGVVYWTNYYAGGAVMSVPVTGGTPTTIATNQDWPWAIAVDDNNVYWTNYDNGSAGTVGAPGLGQTTSGTVMKVAVTGGTPVMLDQGLEGPFGLAIDATNVYYTNAGGGRIKSVPIAGGTATVLATDQVPLGIAVDGTSVYWVSFFNGTVSSTAKAGGSGTKELTASNTATNVIGVAVNATSVFFSTDDGSTTSVIASMPLAGSASPTVLASGQDDGWGIALDATNVYWANSDQLPNGYMASTSLTGGTVTKLATNIGFPTSIAVDATGLYYTGYGGHVWRLTPP